MALRSVNDIAVGDMIRFKTTSPHDNGVWTGVVTAIDDVDSYYQDIKRSDYSVPAKETLSYILLKIQLSDSNASKVAVVAKEWIDESTLEFVQSNTYTDIRIYNIDESKAKDILSYIKATYIGYVAEILK